MGRRLVAGLLAVGVATGLLVVPVGASQLPKPDKAIAQAGLLTIADFPAGWTQQPAAKSKPSKLKSCKTIEAVSSSSQRYEEKSPDFVQGDARVSNAVFVFPNVKKAKAYLAPFQRSGKVCLQDSVRKALPEATVAVTSVDTAPIIQSGIDDAVEFVARLDEPNQGGATQTFADIEVALRSGRTIYTVSSLSPYPPPAELDALISVSLSRMLLAKTKA